MLVWILIAMMILVSATITDASDAIWVKGNTHAHTNVSDGNAAPEAVVEWYKSHGYNFLALTDHNEMVDPSKYDTSQDDGFILIAGEEISTHFGNSPVHVNGLGIKNRIGPQRGDSVATTIQKCVDGVLEEGGIAHINHPNFHFAFNHRELLSIERCSLLEIYNAHPAVYNSGDAAHDSVEKMWDILLSAGKQIYGIATDDAHNYTDFESKPQRANPGRGWIVVRVNKLTPEEVLRNMNSGNFYASTGVELADYAVDGSTIRISVKPVEGNTYATRFVGLHGQILAEVDGTSASYEITGKESEAYVRARVISSDGSVAWTQPVRMSPDK